MKNGKKYPKEIVSIWKIIHTSDKKVMPAKPIKNLKDCKLKCRFKCNIKINDEERKQIFDYFYENLNKNRQYDFIAQTTTTSMVNESSST